MSCSATDCFFGSTAISDRLLLLLPDFAIVGPGKLDVLQRFQDEVLA